MRLKINCEKPYAIVVGNFGTAILHAVGSIGFAIAGWRMFYFGNHHGFRFAYSVYRGSPRLFPPDLRLLFKGSRYEFFYFTLGLCLISIVDNVARPILIGSRKMHPRNFLGCLGRNFVFGLKGLFGPLILSLTSIIHIYQLEYHEVLKTRNPLKTSFSDAPERLLVSFLFLSRRSAL